MPILSYNEAMEATLIVALVILLAVNIAAVVLILRKKPSEPAKTDDTAMKLLLEQMNELNRTMDKKIGETNKTVTESMKDQRNEALKAMGESQKLVDKFLHEITSMTEKVTRVEETGKQMVTFADQLQSLQDILKNPKQ